MNSTVKTAIVAGLSALIAVASYSQVNEYFHRRQQIAEQRQAIQKSVAENTEAANEVLTFEVKPSGVTYGELFERGDDRIKKLSESSILIGTSFLPDNEKGDLKTYVEGLQEVIRLQVAQNRKSMAVSTAIDIAKDASNDYRDSSYLGGDYARKRAQDTLNKAKEAMDELATAEKDFTSRVASFRKAISDLRPKLRDYSLIKDDLLSSILTKHTPAK